MELECEIEEGGTLHATFSTNNMRDDFDSPRITMTIRILVGFLLGDDEFLKVVSNLSWPFFHLPNCCSFFTLFSLSFSI